MIIATDPEWLTRPELAKHIVIPIDQAMAADLILSKKAWKWDDSMWPFVDAMLKQAAKKIERKEKRESVLGRKVRKPKPIAPNGESHQGEGASGDVQLAGSGERRRPGRPRKSKLSDDSGMGREGS